MIYTHKAQFYTYVLARTANLTDFRRLQKLDDVLTTLTIGTRFAWENFTWSRLLRLISSSKLKFPVVARTHAHFVTFGYY